MKYISYEFDTGYVCSKNLIISSYALQKMTHSMSHNDGNIIQKLASYFGLKYKVKRSLLFCLLLMKKFSPFITLRICYIWRCIISAKEGNDRTFLCDFDLLCKSLHLFRLKRLCFTLRISLFLKTMISFHKISWF